MIQADVAEDLFREARMFDSDSRLERAGFEVIKWKPGNVMVARHSRAPDLIFKKYANDTPLDDQLENYRERILGADALRQFIARHHLKHIVVPNKQLYELPTSFAVRREPSYVLLCEYINLLKKKESYTRYEDIAEDVLRELCMVVCKFRGLDSGAHNLPFATSGHIAFIDTENWRREREREKLEYIKKHLSERSIKLAKRWIREFDDSDL